MTISKEMLDELLKGCERPEDLLGDAGLLNRRDGTASKRLKGQDGDPDRQITAPPQGFVVLSPVGHPMLLLRELVTTISVEFVQYLQHPEGYSPHRYQR